MRFAVWPNPQQPWTDVLDVARHAEATGWSGFYFADHFMPNDGDLSQPVLECWSVLAAIGAAVPRLRISALVSGNTYRHPAVLANQAATIDHISGGRCMLGLGAGWQENEHTAYGIPLFATKERLARFDEACQVVKLLLTEERANFDGQYYTLRDASCEPKPVQQPLPLLLGGGGERVTLRIVAEHADEWNVWGLPDLLRQKIGVLEGHCEAVGRDPATIKRSTQALLFLSEDETWLEKRRARPTGRPEIIGTPDEVVDIVAAYRDAGVDELIVPDWTMGTGARRSDTLDLFQQKVASHF